jgi:FixJ family two-component response regulator
MRDIDDSFGTVQEAARMSSDGTQMRRMRERPLVAIVDDDASVCRALKRLLATHGMRVETFASSRIFVEVVEALPSFEPQCVVLDMHMPGLTGLDVHALLASMRPDIPVIYLSSIHDSVSYKRALAFGAVAFFKKPFQDDLDEFVRTLCAILGTEGPRR